MICNLGFLNAVCNFSERGACRTFLFKNIGNTWWFRCSVTDRDTLGWHFFLNQKTVQRQTVKYRQTKQSQIPMSRKAVIYLITTVQEHSSSSLLTTHLSYFRVSTFLLSSSSFFNLSFSLSPTSWREKEYENKKCQQSKYGTYLIRDFN